MQVWVIGIMLVRKQVQPRLFEANLAMLNSNSLTPERNHVPLTIDAAWQKARGYIKQKYASKQLAVIESAGSTADVINYLSILQSQWICRMGR